MQNKKPFEIILHVGRVGSLQSSKGNQKQNIHLQGFDRDMSFSQPTVIRLKRGKFYEVLPENLWNRM